MSKLKVYRCLSYVKGCSHPDESVRTSFRNPQFYEGEVEKCDFVITNDDVIAANYQKAGVELIEGVSPNVGIGKDSIEVSETDFGEILRKSLEEKYSKMKLEGCNLIIGDHDIEIADNAKIGAKRKAIVDHMYFVEMKKSEEETPSNDWG